MIVFDSFTLAIALLLIAFSLVIFFFPPKFCNFWYGITTSLTIKNKIIWADGQKLFAYAIFGIGLIFCICAFLNIGTKFHPTRTFFLLIVLWKLSKYIVHKILEKKYLSV